MDWGSIIQMGIAMVGEQQAQSMSQQQLALLGKQYAEMQGIPLPELPNIEADQLGESAVGGMQSDETLRAKQMQAMGEIQNIIDSGGLDLSDKASLEEAMGAAINQQKRARAGVADDMAQRGQQNSGAAMVQNLDAAQAGANAARQSGLEVAGMAQRRKMQAIHDASGMAGGLREQDWREKEAAARAKDLRDERNANAREKAQYHNAGNAQQGFLNAMAQKTGQMPAANAYSNALGAGATDARQSAAGLGAIAGQAYGGVTKNGGTSGGGGVTLASDDPNYTYTYGTDYGSSDPEEWEDPYR